MKEISTVELNDFIEKKINKMTNPDGSVRLCGGRHTPIELSLSIGNFIENRERLKKM